MVKKWEWYEVIQWLKEEIQREGRHWKSVYAEDEINGGQIMLGLFARLDWPYWNDFEGELQKLDFICHHELCYLLSWKMTGNNEFFKEYCSYGRSNFMYRMDQ